MSPSEISDLPTGKEKDSVRLLQYLIHVQGHRSQLSLESGVGTSLGAGEAHRSTAALVPHFEAPYGPTGQP